MIKKFTKKKTLMFYEGTQKISCCAIKVFFCDFESLKRKP